MDKVLIINIIDSLFSKEVNQEYLNMYLSDSKLRKQCDKMILQKLEEDFSNEIYDEEKSLNYLNNAIKPQLKKKPYLSNINSVKMAIENYIVKIQDERFKSESNDFEYYKRKHDSIIKFSNEINSFIYDNIDIEAEERLANIYIQRMKNNNELSIEQAEELLAFALMGGFILRHEEYTDKAFDYVLKSVLKNDYKIDDYLYKGLFMHSCKKILEERGITDLKIYFDRNENHEMGYNDFSKSILINENELVKRNPIRNFTSFFHELRHYEQYNYTSEDLKSFLIAKDIYLSSILLEHKYYKQNYSSLFSEKDANYSSYKEVYDFIKETAPSRLNNTKKEILDSLRMLMILQNRYITERKLNEDTKDLNVLFEETIRKRKKTFNDFIEFVKSPLLIEYDIFGNKRSIFELLESKEFNEINGSIGRASIINYLLYEESVSLDYISENIKLFNSKEIKEKYKKYYKEAKRVIKHKIIKYRADLINEKKEKSFRDEYKILVLRDKNLRGLNKDERIKLYNRKEEELKVTYKWLYDLLEEERESRKTR